MADVESGDTKDTPEKGKPTETGDSSANVKPKATEDKNKEAPNDVTLTDHLNKKLLSSYLDKLATVQTGEEENNDKEEGTNDDEWND